MPFAHIKHSATAFALSIDKSYVPIYPTFWRGTSSPVLRQATVPAANSCSRLPSILGAVYGEASTYRTVSQHYAS